jgi:hypothetical protein
MGKKRTTGRARAFLFCFFLCRFPPSLFFSAHGSVRSALKKKPQINRRFHAAFADSLRRVYLTFPGKGPITIES